MSAEPIIERTVDGLLIASEDESDQLGLRRREHGLVLLTGPDGSRWTNVTPDLDYFDLYVSALIVADASGEPILSRTDLWPIVLRGWPPPGIGRLPDPRQLDIERD